MVQLAISFVFLLSFTAAGLSMPIKRTAVQIESDISDISTKLTALHNAINQFPQNGGTLQAALVSLLFGYKYTLSAIYSLDVVEHQYLRPSSRYIHQEGQ